MERLGVRAMGRYVAGGDGTYEPMETVVPYMVNFNLKRGVLSSENTYLWDDIV